MTTIQIRTLAAVAALSASPLARADDGMITTTGWLSMLLVVGICVALFGVYKKIG